MLAVPVGLGRLQQRLGDGQAGVVDHEVEAAERTGGPLTFALIDLDHHRLPNAIVLPSYGVLAGLFGLAALLTREPESFARSLAGAGILFGGYLIIAPIPRGVGPMASVDAQVSGLVARVAVVSPDQASRTAIGRNVLDPAARAPSARAGRAQAASVAARIAEVWNG